MNTLIRKLGRYVIPWYISLHRVKGGKFPRYNVRLKETSEDGTKMTTNIVAIIEKTACTTHDYWITLDENTYSIYNPLDPQTGKDILCDYKHDDRVLWMQIEKYFGLSSRLKRCGAWEYLSATYYNFNITTKIDVHELKADLEGDMSMPELDFDYLFDDGSKINIDLTNGSYKVLAE